MTHDTHPTFGKWFQRFFIRAWLIIVALFIFGLLLLKNNLSTLGAIFAISFGLSVPLVICYLIYKLYHIECPNCHMPLTTRKNRKMSKYEATCDRCMIVWDVGIGIGTSD
jgi:hypothetical protein